MTDENHNPDFPADGLDRWVQDQRPPEPSAAFLGHCLATIPPASATKLPMLPRVHVQTLEQRRLKLNKRLRVLGISGALATTVALFLVATFWLTQPAEAQKAAIVLARGAEAVPNVATVHIVAKTRRHFPAVFPDADFAPAEVWKRFGDKPQWRVEQPGKLVVMDGVSTVGLFRRHPEDPEDIPLAEKIPHATPNAWDVYPLLDLANVQGMITGELRSALAEGWDLKLTHETTPAGEKKLLVTVEAKAGLPEGDCLKNTFWDDSDMRRVYRFDAQTQRLDGFEAYLHQASGDVLMLTIEHIEYNKPIDPAVFTLKPPANAYWITDPKPLPDNEKYEKMTPKQTVRALFEACRRGLGRGPKVQQHPVGQELQRILRGTDDFAYR